MVTLVPHCFGSCFVFFCKISSEFINLAHGEPTGEGPGRDRREARYCGSSTCEPSRTVFGRQGGHQPECLRHRHGHIRAGGQAGAQQYGPGHHLPLQWQQALCHPEGRRNHGRDLQAAGGCTGRIRSQLTGAAATQCNSQAKRKHVR